MSFPNSNSPADCLEHVYAAVVDESPVLLVSDRKANLYGLILENDHSSAVFVHFYDKAALADVTVGTTASALIVKIPASGGVVLDPNRAWKHFKNGIQMACVNARTGNTAPGGVVSAHVFFSAR